MDVRWAENLAISETSGTAAVAGDNPTEAATTSTIFQINNAKLYVPVVTLSISNNIKFLEHLKQGSKRTISWKKEQHNPKTTI